jgi:O-antigen/teichoic acid export membrane protein
MRIKDGISFYKKSVVFKNSVWGLASSVIQNLLLSLFFIIVARKYSTFDFAQFLIANTLYQIVAAFSTLGLGQWFIREYLVTDDKNSFVSKFLKIQFYSGFIFYALNIILAFVLYDGVLIRSLAIVLGINVIFDNVIFAIKNLNIADFEQRKTFLILLIDALLRFTIGIALLIHPFSIFILSVLFILTRFGSLNLFIKIGVKNFVGLKSIWNASVSVADFKQLILTNWSFVVIGSLSIVYWRIASIVISKILTNADVANYEVSFKVFLLAQLVPLILSSSVFPSLVKLFENPDRQAFNLFYRKFYLLYLIFGIASYTFIYSFGDAIIPFAFGPHYAATSLYTKQMFLSMIVFPTFFLQANVLIAMKLEKLDMALNIIGLVSYLVIGFIGLTYIKSLSVINYSIFASFIIVHIFQDRILIREKVTTLKNAATFFLVTAIIISSYVYLSAYTRPFMLFFSFWGIAAIIAFVRRNKIITAFTLKVSNV